jgi:hypothetical protein
MPPRVAGTGAAAARQSARLNVLVAAARQVAQAVGAKDHMLLIAGLLALLLEDSSPPEPACAGPPARPPRAFWSLSRVPAKPQGCVRA